MESIDIALPRGFSVAFSVVSPLFNSMQAPLSFLSFPPPKKIEKDRGKSSAPSSLFPITDSRRTTITLPSFFY